MTEITPPVNQAEVASNSALRWLVSSGVTFLETSLNVGVTWTAVPIVRELIDLGMSWVGDKIYMGMALCTDTLIIRFESYISRTEYLAAGDDLHAAIVEGDLLKIKAAKLAWDAAASKEIKAIGSSPP